MTEQELEEYLILSLEEQLQALAMPADVQLTLYPDGCAKVDELAEDFDDIYILRRDTRWRDISPSQRQPLEAIVSLLDEMSGPKPFWTEDALHTRPEWEVIRGLAKQALLAFGWKIEPPVMKHTYKYREDGSISSSTSTSARHEELLRKWESERKQRSNNTLE